VELEQVVARVRTPLQDAMVADTVAYGRALFLDGLVQSAESDEPLYHEILVHPGLVIHGAARRVLVGGAGEGATLRELLKHPDVAQIVAVDLDPEVVRLAQEHLPQWHEGAFDDPRVELRFEDVRDTLARAEPGSFDVVLLDVTDPVDEGPSVELFTVRFFREVQRVLAPGGVMILQGGELDPIDLASARTVMTTLRAAFPWVAMAHTFVPCFACMWGVAIAAMTPMAAIPADLEARIERLRGPLRVYGPERHRAALTLPPLLGDRLAIPGKVVTGDDGARHVAYHAERDGAPELVPAAATAASGVGDLEGGEA
jgi:spermidine synthase